jgi:acetylornithine/N-succinyldiaminopimelate aminotransferase
MVKEARGRGLMLAMEFNRSPDGPSVTRIHRELYKRGFIVGCRPAAQLLRFYPALTIGEEDIARLVENLDHILEILS